MQCLMTLPLLALGLPWRAAEPRGAERRTAKGMVPDGQDDHRPSFGRAKDQRTATSRNGDRRNSLGSPIWTVPKIPWCPCPKAGPLYQRTEYSTGGTRHVVECSGVRPSCRHDAAREFRREFRINVGFVDSVYRASSPSRSLCREMIIRRYR